MCQILNILTILYLIDYKKNLLISIFKSKFYILIKLKLSVSCLDNLDFS